MSFIGHYQNESRKVHISDVRIYGALSKPRLNCIQARNPYFKSCCPPTNYRTKLNTGNFVLERAKDIRAANSNFFTPDENHVYFFRRKTFLPLHTQCVCAAAIPVSE